MTVFCPRLLALAALASAALSLAQAAPAADPAPSSLDDHVELSGGTLSDRAALRQRQQLRESSGASRYTVTHSVAEPLATANQSAGAAGWHGRSPQATQTMLWARPWSGSGMRLGVGVEQRHPAMGGGIYSTPYQNLHPGAGAEAGVLVGLAVPTGPRSHAFVQTPLVDASRPQIDDLNGPGLANREGRQVRVGLAFNSRKPYADLRKGFRMELSGQSSLTLRPRGGKVGVTFQKIW